MATKGAAAAAAKSEALSTYQVGGVALKGRELTVLPVGAWKTSAMKALRAGDLESWAEKCLDAASWVVWQEVDPTLDEAGEFLAAWSAKTGEDSGK